MTDLPPLVVTTSLKATAETQIRARERAQHWEIPFVARDNLGIAAILPEGGAALVFSNAEMHIATSHGRLKHHLGTAFIRLKSLDRGDGDPLVRAGDLRPGDHVLDTTFGLGRDAAVAARAVGATGRITALESSTALFHLADEALAQESLLDASAPITLHHQDARTFLENQADSSADVVLVDPMFTTPKASDAGFEILRAVADTTPLDREWIRAARRAARRCVVVKVGEAQPWFDAESLVRVHSHSSATWYRASADGE